MQYELFSDVFCYEADKYYFILILTDQKTNIEIDSTVVGPYSLKAMALKASQVAKKHVIEELINAGHSVLVRN